jgi:hypothetical protein
MRGRQPSTERYSSSWLAVVQFSTGRNTCTANRISVLAVGSTDISATWPPPSPPPGLRRLHTQPRASGPARVQRSRQDLSADRALHVRLRAGPSGFVMSLPATMAKKSGPAGILRCLSRARISSSRSIPRGAELLHFQFIIGPERASIDRHQDEPSI